MSDNLQFEAEKEINEIKLACKIAQSCSIRNSDQTTTNSFCHELISYKYILDLLKAGYRRQDIVKMHINYICNGKYENEIIIDIDRIKGFTSRFKENHELISSNGLLKPYKALMKAYVRLGFQLKSKSTEYNILVKEIYELIDILEDDFYKQDIYKAYYSETLIFLNELTNNMSVDEVCLITNVDRLISTIFAIPISLSYKDQYNAGKWWANILDITITGHVTVTERIGEVMAIVESKSFPNSLSWNYSGEIEIRSYTKKFYNYKITAGIPEKIEDDLVLRMYYRQILEVALDNNIYTLAFYNNDIPYQGEKGKIIALDEFQTFVKKHPIHIYWIE